MPFFCFLSCPQEKAMNRRRKNLAVPGKSRHSNILRRIAGRLGLDFVVAGVKFGNHQLGKDLSAG
jgi:hypothetical protein